MSKVRMVFNMRKNIVPNLHSCKAENGCKNAFHLSHAVELTANMDLTFCINDLLEDETVGLKKFRSFNYV